MPRAYGRIIVRFYHHQTHAIISGFPWTQTFICLFLPNHDELDGTKTNNIPFRKWQCENENDFEAGTCRRLDTELQFDIFGNLVLEFIYQILHYAWKVTEGGSFFYVIFEFLSIHLLFSSHLHDHSFNERVFHFKKSERSYEEMNDPK